MANEYIAKLSILFILLIIISIYPLTVTSLLVSNKDNITVSKIVRLDLPANIANNMNTSFMITILSSNTEIPLPYIYVPRGEAKIKYVTDYIYHGKRISLLNNTELKYLLENIIKGKIDPKKIKPLSIEQNILIKDKRAGVYVILPIEKLAPSNPDYHEWFREAIRLGYRHRLVYKLQDYRIHLYYKLNKTGCNTYELPVISPSTIIYMKDYKIVNTRTMHRSFVFNTEFLKYSSQSIPRASLVGVEEYHKTKKLVSLDSSGHGIYVWYTIPWNKTRWDPNKKKIILSDITNKTFSGSNYYEISDSFNIVKNTTRYELWTWIQSDKNVGFTLEIKLNNNEAFNQYIRLHKGVFLGVGIIVHTSENPGDYLEPETISVDIILNNVNDSSATIGMHSVVNGRSYVFVSNNEDYYRSYEYVHGVGDLHNSYLNQEQPVDKRYEFIHSGEYVGYLIAPSIIYESYDKYPFYYYPYIYIYIESTDNQLYNRYVDVIINGDQVAHVKTYSSVPDGKPGKRYAYIVVSGGILDSILSSMRMRQAINLIIKIEDFDPYNDAEHWYLSYGYLAYLARPINALFGPDWKVFNPIDYYNNEATTTPIYDYAGVELFNGENSILSDNAEYALQISTTPISPGKAYVLGVAFDLKYGHKPVFNDYLIEVAHLGKVILDAKIESSQRIEIYPGSTGYISGGNTLKAESEAIVYVLWGIGTGLSIISLFGGGIAVATTALAVNILSFPGFYTYGSTYSIDFNQIDDYTCEFTLTYDSGWTLTNKASFELYPTIKPVYAWNEGAHISIDYYYKIYIKYITIDDRPPTSMYERPGYISDEGTLYVYVR